MGIKCNHKEEPVREFRQQHGRSGERYWQIWFEAKPGEAPEIVCSAWGAIKDGKHNEHGRTKDRAKAKGKAGTKAFMTATENAAFEMDRAIRKKEEEGYVEVGLDGRPILGGSTVEAIDHDQKLPKNLCFSKPRNKESEDRIRKLEAANDLLFTRKVNGMMVIAHINQRGMVDLYSRRMENLTYHFPHLVRALGPAGVTLEGKRVPPCTVLLFEAFLSEGNTRRDLLEAQSIMRSLPKRAVELQEERGFMHFYLFRIPIWKGRELEKEMDCESLCYAIENRFADAFLSWRDKDGPEKVKGRFLHAIENFEGTVPEALAVAEAHNYEGWVCYQKTAVLGSYSYSLHGKPDRPAGCFKLKPFQEDDFIAYFDPGAASKETPMGSYGSGKNSDRVGTLSLYQRNVKGDEVYICEVGSGLSDGDRERLLATKYPIVVQVKYEDRFYKSDGDKSNSLSLPSVIGFREDKSPEECVNESLT
jgi:hypothetical protein